MTAKKFQSNEVERQYDKADAAGILAIIGHCQLNNIKHASFADDTGSAFEMKRPDLVIDGSLAEIQVAFSWKNKGMPNYWRRIMIFKRKAGQARYLAEGQEGHWYTVNATGSHALRLSFNAKPIGEGTYYDKQRQTREEVVYYDLADADLIELDKVNYLLN